MAPCRSGGPSKLDPGRPDGLAVATFDEAVELREAGLRLPILVLFPIPPEHAAEAARRRIALTVGDEVLLERTLAAIEAARGSARAGGRRRAPHQLEVHLELETGLGRAGFPPELAGAAAARIAARAGRPAGRDLVPPPGAGRRRSGRRARRTASGCAMELARSRTGSGSRGAT